MTLSVEDRNAVIERSAQILAEKIHADLVGDYDGALGDWQLIPLGLCAGLLGVSPAHARRVLPVVDTGVRPGGVRWNDLKKTIEKRRAPSS